MRDEILDVAVGQLSMVSATMKMLLEACERELLQAAELADPGPKMDPVVQSSGRGHAGRVRRARLRAR